MQFSFDAIGVIRSCFKEKFGVPRQSGLAPDAEAVLELLPPFDRFEAVRELADFSHVWLVFVFHQAMKKDWSPTVRPPRLGGNKRVGVFASRSPFRPNPIGLSTVELVAIEQAEGRLLLRLKGADLVDGTPVLDIKPYVPYADSIPDAIGGFAAETPEAVVSVTFSDAVENFFRKFDEKPASDAPHPNSLPGGEEMPATADSFRRLIVQVLQQDPRPAYMDGKSPRKSFGMRLYDCDIHWTMEGDCAIVTDIGNISGD